MGFNQSLHGENEWDSYSRNSGTIGKRYTGIHRENHTDNQMGRQWQNRLRSYSERQLLPRATAEIFENVNIKFIFITI